MAEPTGTSPTPVSDVMLARYVAGDLQGAQLQRVERAIGETPGLAERLARLKIERDAFLMSSPPQQFAHQVVTRLTVDRPTIAQRWQVWWLLPPVTVAAALLFGVVYQHALGPQSLAPAAVTTDDAYDLPTTNAPIARAEPPVAEAAAHASDPEAAPKELAKTESAATRKDTSAKKVPMGDDGLAADGKRRAPEPLEGLATKDSRGGAGQGMGASAAPRGAATLGRATADTGSKGYAQPPAEQVTPIPTTPAPAAAKPQSVAPPVWAAPPPAAPVQAEAPARREAPVESERDRQRSSAADKAPSPEPRAKPQTNAGPAASGAVMDEAQAPAAPAKNKADEKSARLADDLSASAKEDEDKVVSTSVSVTREQSGRVHAIVNNEIVPAGSLLKVTAQGGKQVTVIGVRRDGVPYVYGQSASSNGQPVTIAIRMRPSSARTAEALFVIMSDAPFAVQKEHVVAGGKDAGQLPLRLTVPGSQRRFVVNVSAAAEE